MRVLPRFSGVFAVKCQPPAQAERPPEVSFDDNGQITLAFPSPDAPAPRSPEGIVAQIRKGELGTPFRLEVESAQPSSAPDWRQASEILLTVEADLPSEATEQQVYGANYYLDLEMARLLNTLAFPFLYVKGLVTPRTAEQDASFAAGALRYFSPQTLSMR
ncbi:MAG: hypothetical protein IPK79_08195 [Vampirovibrionales bacterium]|nr:hypothetical protein [Vampirovibrionales bacterium]